MQGVEIIDLEIVKENEKGFVFQFDNRESSKLLLIKRKKGSISGAHYHTGKNPMSIAAASIYIGCLGSDTKSLIIQRDIAKVAGVTEVTIRNIYRLYKGMKNIL